MISLKIKPFPSQGSLNITYPNTYFSFYSHRSSIKITKVHILSWNYRWYSFPTDINCLNYCFIICHQCWSIHVIECDYGYICKTYAKQNIIIIFFHLLCDIISPPFSLFWQNTHIPKPQRIIRFINLSTFIKVNKINDDMKVTSGYFRSNVLWSYLIKTLSCVLIKIL